METDTEDVGQNKKKQGKGVDKKRVVQILKYGRAPVPKKQAKVVISFDEYEDDGDKMDTDIDEEGTNKLSKLAKKKQKVGKGES